jgi:hypothetical protein
MVSLLHSHNRNDASIVVLDAMYVMFPHPCLHRSPCTNCSLSTNEHCGVYAIACGDAECSCRRRFSLRRGTFPPISTYFSKSREGGVLHCTVYVETFFASIFETGVSARTICQDLASASRAIMYEPSLSSFTGSADQRWRCDSELLGIPSEAPVFL